MFKNNDRINEQEAMFFLVATMIEIGSLIDARLLAQESGPDAWLAYLTGYAFVLPGILAMGALSKRFYKHGFVEYSCIIMGAWIGLVLSMILAAYWLLVSARALRGMCEITKLTLLDKTPTEVIAFSFLVAAIYIARYGIEPLSRMSMLLGISVLPLILLLFAFVIPNVKLDNLLPFMAEGPIPILKAGVKGIADWEEMSLLFIIVPFLSKPRAIGKEALYASVIVAFIGIFMIFLTIGTIGENGAKTSIVPSVSALSAAEYPGMFIERLPTIFIGLWLMMVLPTIAGLLWAAALVLSQMLGFTEYKPLIMPLVPIIYTISLIPQNIIEANKFFRFLIPYGIGILFIMPIILYTIAVIRRIKD
ncbi:GerAB/ArcD/ProY family transporter [Mahella australiensis]|uniref:Spore germination protein n=1 Tax=Mahella australiensis (strain DSM 15567 / CIP 107919 / 50-1 BON) TaxID=697281 RepID=F4A063_MAHA5|nr:endospore germination permease [Mahella australiensis]AEE96897.1 spore germination protein [Mahella australiensis 50-1 BON]